MISSRSSVFTYLCSMFEVLCMSRMLKDEIVIFYYPGSVVAAATFLIHGLNDLRNLRGRMF